MFGAGRWFSGHEHLLHKYEVLSSNPQHHIKNRAWSHTPVSPVLWGGRNKRISELSGHQCSSRVSGRPCLKAIKHSDRAVHLTGSSGLCTCIPVHTQLFIHHTCRHHTHNTCTITLKHKIFKSFHMYLCICVFATPFFFLKNVSFRGWRNRSLCKSACSVSMRTWIWISSTPVKSQTCMCQ